jgi:sporulation protein YlmC with PRC-barrel domain
MKAFSLQRWEANMTDPTTPKAHSLIASDRVEGTVVRRPDGSKLGSIERVMIDKLSGKVAYAVLSFGGFLGLGEKHVPIPWEQLQYDRGLEAYRVNLSDEEIKRAPSSASNEEFDWGDRSAEIEIHNYYGARPYWGAY